MPSPPPNRFVPPYTAVRLAFQNVFNVSGRTSRAAFWWFACLFFVGAAVLGQLDPMVRNAFYILMFFPAVSVLIRRLHDVDVSAVLFGLIVFLWYVFAFILAVALSAVYVNSVFIVVIGVALAAPILVSAKLCAAQGTPGSNRFGPVVEAGLQ